MSKTTEQTEIIAANCFKSIGVGPYNDLKEGKLGFMRGGEEMDLRLFNKVCPVCGKGFKLKSGESVPEHLAVGHISDDLEPCNGTGQEGIELKKIWQR
jgi:hypothetical protein